MARLSQADWLAQLGNVTSLTIGIDDGFGAGDQWGLDNVRLTTAAPVPEPGTPALLFVAVAVAAGAALRHNRAAARAQRAE